VRACVAWRQALKTRFDHYAVWSLKKRTTPGTALFAPVPFNAATASGNRGDLVRLYNTLTPYNYFYQYMTATTIC